MENDKVTISMLEMFAHAGAAREFLEDHRWRGRVHCPTCDGDRITARKGKRIGYYRCRHCKDEFTVRTGTIFERSHVPLHKWLYAIYLLVTARKGISSMQLSKELSVTQATAWFMLGRLREACEGDLGMLSGIVEADETFIDGKEVNKHANKKLNAGRHVDSVESMWEVVKRSVYGTWYHVSIKHVARYVNEATFRLNVGNVTIHTLNRMTSFLAFAFQRGITHNRRVGAEL